MYSRVIKKKSITFLTESSKFTNSFIRLFYLLLTSTKNVTPSIVTEVVLVDMKLYTICIINTTKPPVES